jgi:hypothetical protein
MLYIAQSKIEETVNHPLFKVRWNLCTNLKYYVFHACTLYPMSRVLIRQFVISVRPPPLPPITNKNKNKQTTPPPKNWTIKRKINLHQYQTEPTTASRLNSLNIEKTTINDAGNPRIGSWHAPKSYGVEPVNRIPTLLLIIRSPTVIQK